MTGPVIHHLVQGSEAWHQHRLEHYGASEAAACLGLSKTVTRTELLKAKHTGIAREFSEFVQTRILDHGHAVEAAAREHAEAFIGDDLYAVTCSDGKLSCSCDGLTLDGATAWEHKQYAAELFALAQSGVVAPEHMPQCQQVLMVTGAKRLIFTVSDGTPERMAHVEVLPDPAWFDRIRAGWAQFERDLADYVPPEATPPAPVGKSPETLPALRIEVTGMVTASNLAEFKETALSAIRSVNRDLKTDNDFADAEKACRWASDVETRLAAAKEHALSQTASIDMLFKTIDDISAEARRVRLDLEKLVKARKEAIRGEIVAGGVGAFEKHVRELNASLGRPYMPKITTDFAGVIKGKRTVDSLRDAVDTELARAKIEANAIHQRIVANLRRLTVDNAEHAFLFPDVATLVLKASDDLTAVIGNRIAEHQAKEARRLEAERERIRAEEQAKAQREAAAEAERQRQEAARAAAAAAITAASAPPPAVQVAPPPAVAQAPVTAVRPMASSPATLKLGVIQERLGFKIDAAFLEEKLGIKQAGSQGAAKLYREADWPRICNALMRHIGEARERHPVPA